MLFDALGHVPERGEVVERGGRSFTVEQVEGRRIIRVRISGPVAGTFGSGDSTGGKKGAAG
jgi:Mg2+/Co2+ transporter CorC